MEVADATETQWKVDRKFGSVTNMEKVETKGCHQKLKQEKISVIKGSLFFYVNVKYWVEWFSGQKIPLMNLSCLDQLTRFTLCFLDNQFFLCFCINSSI